MKYTFKALFSFFVVLSILCPSRPVWAQPGLFDGNQGGGLPGLGSDIKDIVKIKAQFTASTEKQAATLFITAEIKKGWHIYSITQAPGGPVRTKIELAQSQQYRLAGEFQSQPKPKNEKQPDAFGDLVVESHYDSVTWYAPIQFASGVEPASLRVEGKITVQPCDANNCLPPQAIPFAAVLGRGIIISKEKSRPSPDENTESSSLPIGVPNSTNSQTDSNQKTIIDSNTSSKASEANQFIPLPTSSTQESSTNGMATAAPIIETNGKEGLAWRPFTLTSFKKLAGPTFDEQVLKTNISSSYQTTGLWREILFGFLGGIILNLMPCVLPVIGLKIIAFVEQSGQNRMHGFLLNVWYSAGLISVFLILAALAVFANLGWGQLFQYPAFNVAMAGVMFVMGLSFLGVWEIPIPGFIGSGKTAELAMHEGFSGAFAKGVVTTILATPCTGPFMASALAWAVSQPPQNTFLVFTSVGLGMASPYLLIGAFPELIRFLPKPGAWMDTFKHIMGFVLMATVVYIFTFLEWAYMVPTIGLLMAFWAGCWWIGRTPLYAELNAKLRAWMQAGAFVTVIWILMFPGLSGLTGGKIEWNGLYSVMNSRLNNSFDRRIQTHFENLQNQGYQLVRGGNTLPPINNNSGSNTIVVDFTADWCATCKTLEATILDTETVRQKIEQNRVVMLKADWTNQDPQVTAMLDMLGAKSVPTLAIFPADRPNNPTIFRGWYSRQDLIKALDDAGPSKKVQGL